MLRRPTLGLLLFALFACAAPPVPVDEDGPDDRFLVDGKSDVGGILEGSPEALGILALASQAERETLAGVEAVGLGARTAGNIVTARSGADGLDGTTDDQPFQTLEALDAVPYVGPKAFQRLLAYARAEGWTRLPPPLAAQARAVPWSGYWWSMEQGELVLGWEDGAGRHQWTETQARAFDACVDAYTADCVRLLASMAGQDGRGLSPLMKFDYYVRRTLEEAYGPGGAGFTAYAHATRWELDNHYIGTNTEHRFWSSRGYAGKCIGWALAAMHHPEPTGDVVLSGVLFRPADIKGLLASIYNGAQFFVPAALTVGNAYHDVPGEDLPEYREDVYPDDFVRALFETIAKGDMLEADLEPGDGVWNYPVHAYELTYRTSGETGASVSAVIRYADDEVGIDGVFSLDPTRSDLRARELTFDLVLPAGWNGDLSLATGGRWTGESVNTHPDALILGLEAGWRESIYDYRNTRMNTEVNFPLLKRERTAAGWVPVVDQLLARYAQGF